MRQHPLRLQSNSATAFEQSGEAHAFRAWLDRERADMSPYARRALVRHLGRTLSALGATQVNSALYDLPAFERRLRMTVAREPSVPGYATRHWKRAVRHFVTAAYGMTGPEVRRVLDQPRQTLKRAYRADARAFTLQAEADPTAGAQRPDRATAVEPATVASSTDGEAISLDHLVAAVRSTLYALKRLDATPAGTGRQLIEAQLALVDTAGQLRLLQQIPDGLKRAASVADRRTVTVAELTQRVLADYLAERADLDAATTGT